jgi:hypothetical protein
MAGLGRLVGEVTADPLGEPFGLAHVEHASAGVLEQVNPWYGWKIVDLLAQEAHDRLRTPSA